MKRMLIPLPLAENKSLGRLFVRQLIFPAVFMLFLSFSGCSPSAMTVYVSPDGDDAGPGTKEQPFASIERARDEVRIRKETQAGKDITVFLRSGVYQLKNTVVFNLKDSAGSDRTVTYAAYPGETPIITSGMPITKWEKLTDVPAELPQAARGNVWVADVSFIREWKARQATSPTVAPQMNRIQRFLMLYDGEQILPRARGERFWLTENPASEFTGFRTFAFPRGSVKNWSDIQNAEVVTTPQHIWINNILPLQGIDESKGLAFTTASGTYPLRWASKMFARSELPKTWIENTLAVLDEPGEWVLDSKTDTLYLWPRDGEPGDDIVAPVLTELIRVEGEIDYEGPKDTPVRNLVFRGITFARADRFAWEGQTGWGLQHDWERFDSPSAMLRFRGAENCTVEDCDFTTSGSSGVRFDLHCRENNLVGNRFQHLGGVAVLFNGYGPGTKDVNRDNKVENNYIHHIGELYWGSPAMFFWQSGGNYIAQNLIHDVPYAGICVTGRIVWDPDFDEECANTIRWKEMEGSKEDWGYGRRGSTWYQREKYLHARNNTIFRNNIHHVMQQAGDGNCIYISGTGAGNMLLENYCHDSPGKLMHASIRCDDDQNGTTIKRNIIYNNGGYAEGILIKGKNNIIENIIVGLYTEERHRGYLVLARGNVAGSEIKRNVFYSREKGQITVYNGNTPEGKPAPKLRQANADYNLYYCTSDPEWGTMHLQKNQPYGIEKHSISADPMFVDIDKENFRFQPGSPALKLGISQPISIEQTGPQKK